MRTRFPIFSLVLGTLLLLFVLGLLTQATTAVTTTDQFTYLPLIQKPGTPPPPILPPTITTTTLTISAYQYDHPDCIIPTQPGDFVYPYPRINHDCVMQKPKIDRQFTAVILQNSAISLTVLPELGGRLYQIEDKATGRRLLYNNPVLKPTAWGWRGWWLAAGGIEWAFPTDEHGLNEYRPWQYATQTLSNTVTITVSDVEDKTGMEAGVTPDFWTYVSLAAGETISWTEKWYPVNGLGGVDTANEQAALRLVDTGTGAEFWLMSTAVTPGALSIWVNGSQQAAWPVTLIPGQPYAGSWARPSSVDGPITLQLTDSKGNILISWTE